MREHKTKTVGAIPLAALTLVGVVGLAGCSGNNGGSPALDAPTHLAATYKPDGALFAAAARQNDTGITFSGNHPRTVNPDCRRGEIDPDDEWLRGEVFTQLDFGGQDCEHGRDANPGYAGNGHAGFSFVKVAADGALLPATAAEWHCVLDQVTGLMWETKQSPDFAAANTSVHGAEDRFSWHSTDFNNNGGDTGDWNSEGEDCAGYQPGNPASYCNTQAFVERVNAQALCSFSDWRLPTLQELMGIVNFDRTEPAIDIDYFPYVGVENYWVSNPTAISKQHAAMVSMRYGMARVSMRMDRNRVMLVRGQAVGQNP